MKDVIKAKQTGILNILIFLFPIAIIGIRHWGSIIFGLIVITSLISLPKIKNEISSLYKEEKVLLLIFFIYFLVSLVSIVTNKFDQAGIYALGTELRFLMIITVYVALRSCDGLWIYLWAGSLVGIVFTTGVGLYDLYVENEERAGGMYGTLFFGPILLLFILLQIPWCRSQNLSKLKKYSIWIISFIGLLFVVNAATRSAFVAMVAAFFVLFFYLPKTKKLIIILLFAGLLSYLAYEFSPIAQNRINDAFSQTESYIKYYINHPNNDDKYGKSGTGMRLEMWRTAMFIFLDHPWVGVGRYHYTDAAKKYVELGLVDKSVIKASHPHSVIFEAMEAKGIFGLIAVLGLYIYPLYIFIKTRGYGRESALAGILLMVSIYCYSLTEVAPVYFGNFVSVFLVYLSVIFSWHVKQIRRKNI